MRVLVVDNYDSFVFNLVQYLGQLGVQAQVWRNDDDRLATDADVATVAEQFDGVLLSPGPGTPERAGASIPLVKACAAAKTPLLGRVPRPPGHRRGVRRHRRPRARTAARQDQHRATTRMPVCCKGFRIHSPRRATTR